MVTIVILMLIKNINLVGFNQSIPTNAEIMLFRCKIPIESFSLLCRKGILHFPQEIKSEGNLFDSYEVAGKQTLFVIFIVHLKNSQSENRTLLKGVFPKFFNLVER